MTIGFALFAAHQAANATRIGRAGGFATQPFFAFLRHRLAGPRGIYLVCGLVAVALAGCGFGNGPGSLMVDPGRYEGYRCNDLVTRWKELLVREKELGNLMDKASRGGGGTVVGTLAYRPDYESVLTEKKLVQQQAAEKKCELVASFQSDQTIH